MIKARHHPFFVKFFHFYGKFMLHRHFHEINLKGTFTEKNMPVLLIANHFSWWDGFFADYLNHLLFKRRFHIMMLEEQLRQRMFFNKAGAYSIKKNSRDVFDTLNYTVDLLKDPQSLVVMYPQGEFKSLYHYPIQFEKGVASIINKLYGQVQVVFLTALVDYFEHRKPTLTLGLMEYEVIGETTLKNLEEAYNNHLQDMINQQKEKQEWQE